MSALQVAHPNIYRRYSGYGLGARLRTMWMFTFFIALGGYRSEVSDPEVYALASRYRVILLSYLAFFLVFILWTLLS